MGGGGKLKFVTIIEFICEVWGGYHGSLIVRCREVGVDITSKWEREVERDVSVGKKVRVGKKCKGR